MGCYRLLAPETYWQCVGWRAGVSIPDPFRVLFIHPNPEWAVDRPKRVISLWGCGSRRTTLGLCAYVRRPSRRLPERVSSRNLSRALRDCPGYPVTANTGCRPRSAVFLCPFPCSMSQSVVPFRFEALRSRGAPNMKEHLHREECPSAERPGPVRIPCDAGQ